jgi:mannose-6-phosphate isomerase-like protein (cupin superfamily)
MAIVCKPKAMKVHSKGEGCTVTTLADKTTIGTSAIGAYRWSFNKNSHGPELVHGECEQLLFVISGRGIALVNGKSYTLETEAVLWLNPRDVYQFMAGEDGLEILQGFAPGE